MNKYSILVIFLSLVSCGISNEQYEKTKSETVALQHKVDSLQTVINELQKAPSTLLAEAQLQVKTGEYKDARQTLLRVTHLSITTQEKKEAFKLLGFVNGKLEDIAYKTAITSKNVVVFNNFINDYPKSKYIKRVKSKVKKITASFNSGTYSNNVNSEETSLNGSKDISSDLKYSEKTINNWSTTSSSRHAKSLNHIIIILQEEVQYAGMEPAVTQPEEVPVLIMAESVNGCTDKIRPMNVAL